jgi:hypothetical protein
MKISFSKYGLDQLLTRKPIIISFIAIVFFSAVCGTYLLGNKLWFLTITVLGIAGVLLCFGLAVGVAIFLNKSEVNEAPSAFIEENVPRLTPQWEYRPKKAIRRYATVDGPAAEAVDIVNSNPSEANTSDDVWFSFINVDPAGRDATTNRQSWAMDVPSRRTTKVL